MTEKRCWYWNRHPDIWVTAYIVNNGYKNGLPVFDVRIEDTEKLLPEHYKGFHKWGYEWQITSISKKKPDPPDLSKVRP